MTGVLFPDLDPHNFPDDLTSDDWYTPEPILAWAAKVLRGPIDTDPCWDPRSFVRPVLDAWTKQDDGLSRVWRGRCFVNPPYSNPAPWLRRCAMRQRESVALVKLDPSTAAWNRWIWPHARAVCFFGRRVHYARPGVGTSGAPPWPSAAIWFAPRSVPANLELLRSGPGISAVARPPW